MFSRTRFVIALFLLFSFPVLSLFAQETREPAKVLPLNETKTFADVMAYLQAEINKHDPTTHSDEENATVLANLFLSSGDKMLEIAKSPDEKMQGYNLKLSAYNIQMANGVEGAEQKFHDYIEELSRIPDAARLVMTYQFRQFQQKSMFAEPSTENFAQFKTELKAWIEKKVPVNQAVTFGLMVAERNKVPAGDFIKEMIEYIKSPQCTALTAEEKEKTAVVLDGMTRLTLGNDPKLYGKTIDDKDFDWKTFRGKYVLIKFTATWCGPCKMEVPGMLEAYKKYHDKGLEIISVYVFQRENDPVATVKKFVEEEKLPWIILSEELTGKAKQPKQSDYYGVRGVPTMVLVDKEGKVIMTEARGDALQTKLAEIFK